MLKSVSCTDYNVIYDVMIQSDTGNNVCKERTRGVGCVAVQPPLVPPGRFGRLRSIVWSEGPVFLALFYNNCSRFGNRQIFVME